MKCRDLRTRYIVFKSSGGISPCLIPTAIARFSPPESRIKLVGSDGQYSIVRLDQKALKSIQSSLGRRIELQLSGGSATSLVSTGTIKKAKEKIKAIRGN
ncbi:MAG: hypothetical protein QFX34_01455 [Candidatus Verstraetearchaeota archaeon]|nr:hypothetical protein [Candidatus Verstraetearchaeota archaeon]